MSTINTSLPLQGNLAEKPTQKEYMCEGKDGGECMDRSSPDESLQDKSSSPNEKAHKSEHLVWDFKCVYNYVCVYACVCVCVCVCVRVNT